MRDNKLDNDIIKKLELLTGWYWEKEDTFDKIYDELKVWLDKNKKIPKRTNKNYVEKRLSTWCNGQRCMKKKNKLSDDKIKKLELLNGWYWNTNIIKEQKSFDEIYDKLKEWININNRIPLRGSKNIEERKLSIWCNSRRQDKKKNKLLDEQIKKLELLNGWYWKKDNTFDKKYEELIEWINKNNKLPEQYSKNNIEIKLFKWYNNIKIHKDNLSNYKINKMELIDDWSWEGENLREDIFNKKYQELKEWIKTNNKLPSQIGNTNIEKKLGAMCTHIRQYKKNNNLTDDRIKKIETLNGWYWEKDDFNKIYEELKEWININNKFPSQHSINLEEKKLGKWCSHKRENKKKNKLTDEQIKKLELLNYWFWKKK
jgi:hypothetical protein